MTERASSLNREERDLLIRLDTKMTSVEAKLIDMSGNYTSRLLNLEGNAVSKIELNKLEECVEELKLKLEAIKTWGAAAVLAIGLIEFGVQLYFRI